MNRQASPSPRSGGGRGWLLFVAALVFAILLFAVVRRPQQPPAPARAPAADHVEKPATPDKLPQIPFKDVTAEYGITFVPHGGATGEKMLPESGGSGCALFDYDGDGDPDLLLISGHEWPWDEPPVDAPASTLALYRNDGEKFTDVTAEAGLSADFYGQGAAVGDYDADGDDDLYVTAVGPNRLYRNDGGKFTEATADAGVAGDEGDWTTSAGFFDYDRDGDLDLFVCNYLRWTRERDQEADRRVPGTGVTYAHPSNFDGVQNFLYRNDGGKFVEVGEEAGIHVDDPRPASHSARRLP